MPVIRSCVWLIAIVGVLLDACLASPMAFCGGLVRSSKGSLVQPVVVNVTHRAILLILFALVMPVYVYGGHAQKQIKNTPRNGALTGQRADAMTASVAKKKKLYCHILGLQIDCGGRSVYYIGRTTDRTKWISDQFDGNGAMITQKYPPQQVFFEKKVYGSKAKARKAEAEMYHQMKKKFGKDNVRGNVRAHDYSNHACI